MVKRRREEIDSDGATETENTTSYKTVFIDTNLDTHLAVIVSDSDTISDLKSNSPFFIHLDSSSICWLALSVCRLTNAAKLTTVVHQSQNC